MKLFVAGPGVDEAQDLWDDADLVTVALIAHPEARAALAAAARAGRISTGEMDEARHRLNRRWEQTHVVDLDGPIAFSAGDLAERFGLRGYDAVHLATAASLQDGSLLVATWDTELRDACLEWGLAVAPAK